MVRSPKTSVLIVAVLERLMEKFHRRRVAVKLSLLAQIMAGKHLDALVANEDLSRLIIAFKSHFHHCFDGQRPILLARIAD